MIIHEGYSGHDSVVTGQYSNHNWHVSFVIHSKIQFSPSENIYSLGRTYCFVEVCWWKST